MDSQTRPLIGIAPYFVVSWKRIISLAEAIEKYGRGDIGATKPIKRWAQEIIAQCELIESLESGGKQNEKD